MAPRPLNTSLAHVPYLYLPGPWRSEALEPTVEQRHHLERVLRIGEGDLVEYTDGQGRRGRGAYAGGRVERGREGSVARPVPPLEVAVAPPRARERTRFVVEKLAELGVARLVWLRTRFGEGRAPAQLKSVAWAVGALQQSRGAYLLELAGETTIGSIRRSGVVVAERGGAPPFAMRDWTTLVVGPEGGFDAGEVPRHWQNMALSPQVLRTETAAVVGAALLLACGGPRG